MDYTIGLLENEIKKQLNDLKNYESAHSNDYEYIAEVKEIINEIRRAITVLKYFNLENCKIDLGKIKLTLE